MQAMILAAGMGRRLGPYTDGNTKCMVKVAGRTLIHRMLDSLTRHPLSKIILVVGYKGENLQKHVGDSWNGVPVVYVTNEIYDKTNNIYSLYLARHYLMEEDTLLLESDLIFSDAVLDALINDRRKSLVLVSRFQTWMDGTVVRIGKKEKILQFISGKKFNYALSKNYYKTVNIYKFSTAFSRNRYIPFLEAYVQAMGHNEYYEQVLGVINSLDRSELRACILDRNAVWYEIDDKQDLDNAEVLFSDTSNKLKKLQGHYGGYWRYPALIDFCYLVNPYFPSKRLRDELKNSFDTLLTQYPSGQSVQNLLASKLFGVDEKYIMTGNGAAELIKAMMENVPGVQSLVTGFVYPAFEEYPNRVCAERTRFFEPSNKDFRYGMEELKEFAQDLDRLVLINPDNPSGNFICRSDVLSLASFLKEAGTDLIVDESFVDFSQDGSSASLLENSVLEEYPNLVVVKSISKSYGVPGLRLGVAASSNEEFISALRQNLSIWNINSFAEFFLQIMGKYQAQYAEACAKICRRRDELFEALSGIPGIRPLPSQANYITCELTAPVTAAELTGWLLSRHDIFIKDLTGKRGIPAERQYVRLAVRSSSDNKKLLKALSKKMNKLFPENS